MGWRSRLNLEAFREQTGIRPATGDQLEHLRLMQQEAFKLIKVVEREISGIRDGDGRWDGSDVLSHVVDEINAAAERWWSCAPIPQPNPDEDGDVVF